MKRKEEDNSAVKHSGMRPTDVGAIAGEVAGAVIGSIAGPAGALAGVVLGGIAGSVAGHVLEVDEERAAENTKKLDEEIGVEGGDIGAARGTRVSRNMPSSASSGVGSEEGASAAEGPIQDLD
jgi:hypothetical protein